MDIQLIKECEAKAQAWLDSPYYDAETKAEISAMLKNEDKTDNRAENLEWCTKMYNNHYGNAQRKLSETHTNHPNLSKPVFQKDKDGCLVNMFPSAAEASRQTGIPQSAIVRCCNGEKYYKSAGGYIWEYIPE